MVHRVLTPLATPLHLATKNPSQVVKAVIQHVKTSLYFAGPGTWTRSLQEAFNFGHTCHAVDHAKKYRLPGVQVLLILEQPSSVKTFHFPVPEAVPRQPFATR